MGKIPTKGEGVVSTKFDEIKKDLEEHRVVLYMKGSKLMPQCGFSGQVVHILQTLGVSFEARNILEDPELRQAIKDFSNWPTLPQLYIDGKFIGGCDIVTELFESGQLQKTLDVSYTES